MEVWGTGFGLGLGGQGLGPGGKVYKASTNGWRSVQKEQALRLTKYQVQREMESFFDNGGGLRRAGAGQHGGARRVTLPPPGVPGGHIMANLALPQVPVHVQEGAQTTFLRIRRC